jgi:hypothetical protein
MDNNTKVAVAAGAGIVAGKMLNNWAWLLVAGVLTYVVLKQPKTRAYLKSKL